MVVDVWRALTRSGFTPTDGVPFVDKTKRYTVTQIYRKLRAKPDAGELALTLATRNTRHSEAIARFYKSIRDGTDVEDILQYRSSSDAGLRNIRFPDLWGLLKPEVVPVIIEYDYIMALNLALLSIRDWRSYSTALSIGLFNWGIKSFLTNASRLSTMLKFSNIVENPIEYIGMIEIENLTGYRNLPDPSFDYWRDVNGLAQSGHDVKNIEWKKHVLNGLFPVTQVALPGFREWVDSLSWVTAGSSSIGKVEVEVDGDTVKFKARKNCVPYILTLDEVMRVVEKTMTCENTAILKQELKKVRIAVAADIGNYLIQSYLLSLIGDSYKRWPGNTLAESAAEERIRLSDMMHACENRYGLPFDYAAFDHQPSREEIIAILDEIFSHVTLSEEQSKLYARMIHNLNHEFLTGKFENVVRRMPILGGLMSGYRITSIIGNCWNTWMTACASELSDRLFGFRPAVRYLRGDDSALYFDRWWQACIFRYFYAVVQADGNDKKFGIIWEKMEFLRTLITPTACYAYPNRAAAGITQRKPWSGEKWHPMNTVVNLCDAIDRTARRQWTNLDSLKEHILSRYCAKSGISKGLLHAPLQRGGAGLIPWQFDAKSAIPKFAPHVNVTSDWMERHFKEIAPEILDVKAIVQSHASAVVTADDVPGISRILRRTARLKARSAKLTQLPRPGGYWPNVLAPPPPFSLTQREQLLIEARQMTWGDAVRTRPHVWEWIRRIERRGCPRWLCRTLVEGDAPGYVNLDPKFRGLLSARVLHRVGTIYSKDTLRWLSSYSRLLAGEADVIRVSDEYYKYGHL